MANNQGCCPLSSRTFRWDANNRLADVRGFSTRDVSWVRRIVIREEEGAPVLGCKSQALEHTNGAGRRPGHVRSWERGPNAREIGGRAS
jgi:hypothetical protein